MNRRDVDHKIVFAQYHNTFCTTCKTWLTLLLVTEQERRDAGPLTEMCALCRLRRGTKV